MRKFLSLVSLLVLLCFTGMSQDYVIPLNSGKSQSEVLENNSSSLRMVFNLANIYGNNVTAKNGMGFTEFYFSKGYFSGQIGEPKLPAFKQLIQIPLGADAVVNVKGFSKNEIKLEDVGIFNKLYPVQPSLRKDQNINDVKFEYSEQSYKKEGYIGKPVASIEVLGTMRGVRIARIEINPVDYNPTEGKIMVYNDIEVEVTFKGADHALEERVRKATASPYFKPIYDRLANSYTKDVYDDHPDLTNYPVRMLMVSHRMFEATLQPFIEWKTKKGFYVEVAYTDVIGTTNTDIQTFVHNVYNNATPENPAPSFLIFVGDIDQVPASATGSSSQKKTDLYYASVDGDYFPEMYYGRFSATNTTQLQNIIDKILYYEQYQFADPSYLNKTTLIAGVDGNWNPKVGQPTIKYGTKYYFNPSQGYTTVNEYGVANDPFNPGAIPGYTGCYEPERINVGFINYTAHCSETSWGDPLLSIPNVNAFTNINKYPLAVGNCCLAADFGYNECIGEAWIRKANGGAVSYIGSSPNSYWFEDFYWSVGAFPIVGDNNGYVPTFEETTLGAYDAHAHSSYVTTGGMVFTGNLAVTEVDIQGYPSHSSPLYYWQAYNVLGDPSLTPFFTEGDANTVSHMAIVPIGLSTYTVNALPGSYVAISKNGVLHGAALVDGSGEVEVTIEPITDGGDVDIVVTRPQTVPYVAQVPAAALEGPYVVMHEYTVNDESGNNNGMVEYGESFAINVTLKNVGADDGANITAQLSGTDQYFTITQGASVSFGSIPAGEAGNMVTVNNAFTFTVANNVPNQYQATFVVEITDGTDSWTSNLKIKANAPVLTIGGLTIEDGGTGIPGILDPGETASAEIAISNTGAADATDLQAALSTASPYVTLGGTNPLNLGSLAAGASTSASFEVTASGDTPLETAAAFTVTATAGEYAASKELSTVIGYIPEYPMSSTPVTACIGKFYDSGGANGQYANSENFTKTFYPTSTNSILAFTFTSFDVESGYDYLYIYNGPSTSSPLIGTYSGTNSPGTIFSTHETGAITFKFTSDGVVVKNGWQANFSCITLTDPPACAGNPYPADGTVGASTGLTLSWDVVLGSNAYDVYLGAGTLPAEPTATVATNSYVPEGLTPGTHYVWRVVPKNGVGPATGCATWGFITGLPGGTVLMHTGTVSTCNSLFYDTGGASGSYNNSENHTLTVNPGVEGARVRVTFLSFEVESNTGCTYDHLKVYDGASTEGTLLGTFCGTALPGPFTSTTGSLTFLFKSDGSVVKAGWSAQLSCVDVPADEYAVTFTVTDGTDALAGATIAIGGGTLTTDATGGASLNLPVGFHAYTVTAEGYEPQSGTVAVASEPVSVAVVLNPAVTTYTVSFVVTTTDEQPLAGATIAIGGEELTTDAAGAASIALVPGTYAYTVTHADCHAHEGSLEVTDHDMAMPLTLVPTGIGSEALAGVQLYPNPFGDRIVIAGADRVRSVAVHSILGQPVLRAQHAGGPTLEVGAAQLPAGVYLVTLTGEGGATRVARMVKR